MEAVEKTWSLCGIEFSLELWPGKVFVPTAVSEVIAQQLTRFPRETVVIDMGCGSGFFAVLAAKLGAAKIYAVDVTAQAVELTKKNLARNGIAEKTEVLCGNLFEPLKGIQAHQIILDVSGVASRLARFTPWYPEAIASASEDGTEPTISALSQAWKHLSPGGRLIFPCGSLAHESRIIETATEIFRHNLRLLSEKLIPVTRQLREAFDQCHDLIEKGWVSPVERRGKKYWLLHIYEGQSNDG
jgi:methylase of polypeptide subunit release factors